MEIILKFWPVFKITLGVIFMICCFILLFLLITLAVSKKKLGIYIAQIEKTGTIKNIKDIDVSFDLFLVVHIFDELPSIKNNHTYSKFKEVIELEDRIIILTKFIKPIAIVFFTTVVLLIILLNWLEE